MNIYMYVYMYINTFLYIYVCVYIYIYIERERFIQVFKKPSQMNNSKFLFRCFHISYFIFRFGNGDDIV